MNSIIEAQQEFRWIQESDPRVIPTPEPRLWDFKMGQEQLTIKSDALWYDIEKNYKNYKQWQKQRHLEIALASQDLHKSLFLDMWKYMLIPLHAKPRWQPTTKHTGSGILETTEDHLQRMRKEKLAYQEQECRERVQAKANFYREKYKDLPTHLRNTHPWILRWRKFWNGIFN